MNNQQLELLAAATKEHNKIVQQEAREIKWATVEPWLKTVDVFIDLIKKDSEFATYCGVKYEERELNRDERIDLYCKEYTLGIRQEYNPPYDNFIDAKLKTRNIPTKLITVTYNNETIESYE